MNRSWKLHQSNIIDLEGLGGDSTESREKIELAFKIIIRKICFSWRNCIKINVSSLSCLYLNNLRIKPLMTDLFKMAAFRLNNEFDLFYPVVTNHARCMSKPNRDNYPY